MLLNKEVKKIIEIAFEEDAVENDLTTFFTIPSSLTIEAVILAKESGILCGLEIARLVFKEKDKKIKFKPFKREGEFFKNNEKIVYLKGKAESILICERLALNFLSFLSGIATTTKEFVEKVKDLNVKIMDTRKTTPNLRVLEKYAVRIGGGFNHRMNLKEAVLIKDNHLRAARFIDKDKIDLYKISKCIKKIRKYFKGTLEIEVENLKEFKAIIQYEPDIIMLDNFSLKDLKKAVNFRNKFFPKVKLEASGRVNLKNVRKIANTGVDFISIGALTHSSKAIDFSLEIL